MSSDNLPSLVVEIPEDPPAYQEHKSAAKLWARDAWWTGKYSISEIAESISVSDSQIKNWIYGTRTRYGWAYDKEQAEKQVLKKTIKNNAVRLDDLIEKLITALERSASAILDENTQLTVDEFNKMVNAFEKIFKIRQLSLGKATEIFAGENGELPTWGEIMKKIEDVKVPVFEVVDG